MSSIAEDVSWDGAVVVGSRRSQDQSTEAFRWTATDGMVGLGDLGPAGDTVFHSEALATSGDGSIVVGIGFVESVAAAFIWDQANGMRSLQTVLADAGVNLQGFTSLQAASGISKDGRTIVGWGLNSTGHVEGWLVRFDAATQTPVPEPATLTLAAIGGAIALGRSRRGTRRPR